MSSVEIQSTIIKITAETLRVEASKITPQSSFVDDLGADSLDQVELMMAIEAAFDCDIPDEDASKITTVADAVQYIEQKRPSAPTA
jgi:acyl carrier protein